LGEEKMAFWKPGTEKPRFEEDGEGGIVFMSNNLASSSSSRYANFSFSLILLVQQMIVIVT